MNTIDNDILVFTLLEQLLNNSKQLVKFSTSLLKSGAITPAGLKGLPEHVNEISLFSSFIWALTITPQFKEIDWVKCRLDTLKELHQLFYEYAMVLDKHKGGGYKVNCQFERSSEKDSDGCYQYSYQSMGCNREEEEDKD